MEQSSTESQFKIFNDGQICVVHVTGAINEETIFQEIDPGASMVVTLDLDKVVSLNSMGLRNWVLWVKQLRSKFQMVFRNCPRVVVDQMNILNGFLPMGAIVGSFYVPYYCESCGREDNLLATRGKDYMEATVDAREGIKIPEQRPCPVCQEEMALDVIPAKYFSFLKYRR